MATEVPPPPSPVAAEGAEMTREAMEQQPFVDRHWLYYNPLRRDTVLTYFAQSRFYDRASCNEELRMQGATDADMREHLKGMTGVQFLAEEVPGPVRHKPDGTVEPTSIFVIQKLLRSSPDQDPQVLDVYYVLNGMIYQAPTIFSVLNARLRRCAHLLNQAQRTLGQAVGFEYHQQAGAHAYDHAMAAMGGGGSADLYALKRGRGAGGGKRGSGRGGKRAKQQQAQHPPYPHHHGYPMMMPPPPHIASAGGYEAYYPPLRGEDMVMVDVGDGGQVPPPPLPSPGGSAGLVPPPPPGMEQELPPRLISRYPGPSPLTDVMTAAHPEGGAAVDKVVSGVVEEFRQNGGSTSSASTAATAATGPESASASAPTAEVTSKEEI